jgi:hypothetical protein
MVEFLQNYGIWMFFGLLFSLMWWGQTHGYGMNCCGDHQREPMTVRKEDPSVSEKRNSDCHW